MAPETPSSTVPDVVSNNYQPKGSYKEIGNLSTYITRKNLTTDPSRAIILVYDGFGLSPQTLQGADRLATSLGDDSMVLIPDLFEGNPAKKEWWPTDTEEKKAALQKFAEEKGDQAKNWAVILGVVKAAEDVFPEVKEWGAIGLGWGAKIIAVFASGEASVFKATAQAFPSKPTTSDAHKIAVPHLCLASASEDIAAIKGYATLFNPERGNGQVTTFPSVNHGFMGGFADLENPRGAEAYAAGYEQAAQFFLRYL